MDPTVAALSAIEEALNLARSPAATPSPVVRQAPATSAEQDPAAAALSAIEMALNLADVPTPASAHPTSISNHQTVAMQAELRASQSLISELETISIKLGELKSQIDGKVFLAKNGVYLDDNVLWKIWNALELKPGYGPVRLDLKKLFGV